VVTILQYVEGLTDRQAADAVRSRIDWKYLLAFAGVLDQKLEEISTSFDVPLQKMHDVCLLQRLTEGSI
jgi:hypothetical protein